MIRPTILEHVSIKVTCSCTRAPTNQPAARQLLLQGTGSVSRSTTQLHATHHGPYAASCSAGVCLGHDRVTVAIFRACLDCR